jgi:hypothetical protein
MLIRVRYRDLSFDFLKPTKLDQFLSAGEISMFRRKSGWVFVGVDPVRNDEHITPYCGEERRGEKPPLRRFVPAPLFTRFSLN